jgi:hypothetical protein
MIAQEGQHGVQDFGGHAGGGVVIKIINFLLAHKWRICFAMKLTPAAYRAVAASSRKCTAADERQKSAMQP